MAQQHRDRKKRSQMANSEQPVIDPTQLTTEQLYREVGGLRGQLERENKALRELLEARLDGGDKAIELLQRTADKIPNDVIKAIERLQELHEEKFRSIEVQFKERDVRTEQQESKDKVAIDAALQAQKEAVGEQNKSSALAIAKSEAATTKQIDGIVLLLQTQTKAADDKFDDMKERVAIIEGKARDLGDVSDMRGRITTIESMKKGGEQAWGMVAAIITLGVLLLGGLGTVITIVASNNSRGYEDRQVIERRVQPPSIGP